MHKQKGGLKLMEEINVKELWQYFMSKIYIAIIAVIICLVLGNIYLFGFQTPLYKSTTSLVLVNEERSTASITQNDINLNNNLVSTYSEIIKSRNVLSQVAENLGLEESVENLSRSVSVSSVTDTQIIKVDVSRESKEEAKLIANEIAKVFSKEVRSIYRIQNISVVDKAQLAKKPYNISVVKQNIIYTAAGMVLGMGIIFIIFYFDTSIKDAKTVEDKLNLTVLGVVPKVGDKNGSKK